MGKKTTAGMSRVHVNKNAFFFVALWGRTGVGKTGKYFASEYI